MATETTEKKAPSFLLEHQPEGKGFMHSLKSFLGLTRPDLHNPVGLMRAALYGPGLVNTALDFASRAPDVADLGCGSGWFSLEVARRNPQARIRAIDKDAEALAWARTYYERHRHLKGAIEHVEADLAEIEFDPQSLDVVVAFFVLGALEQPLELLAKVKSALRPGGVLIYYDGTDAPSRNLEKLSRLMHRRSRFRGKMSDTWTERRKLEDMYLHDLARGNRPAGAPSESEVSSAIARDFDVLLQSRQRAFIDLKVKGLSPGDAFYELPWWKMLDDLLVRVGYLEGATRFLLARKRG